MIASFQQTETIKTNVLFAEPTMLQLKYGLTKTGSFKGDFVW